MINVKTPGKDLLTTSEATEFLGIRRQTLYAYVSRGLVRSVSGGAARERLYAREDLERLQQRAQARRGQGAVAAVALNLGHPLVATSITDLTPRGPSYRGRLAIDLARQGARFEQVAELLWTGLWHQDPFTWEAPKLPQALIRLLGNLQAKAVCEQLPEVFALVVLQLGMGRGPVHDRLIHGNPLEAARELILTLVGCLGYLSKAGRHVRTADGQSVAAGVLQALGRPANAQDTALLDATLVLLADHELSPGTFAARIAASSGSAIHACLAAGLAASSGAEVARRYQRVDAFLDGLPPQAQAHRHLQELVSQGQAIPGFDHPLYPTGDPRAAWLFTRIQARRSLPAGARQILSLVEHVRSHHGIHPRHELAVIAACRALRLPAHTATGLFLLARAAGWVAHVLEQRLSPTLIRPRAKFVQAREAAGGAASGAGAGAGE